MLEPVDEAACAEYASARVPLALTRTLASVTRKRAAGDDGASRKRAKSGVMRPVMFYLDDEDRLIGLLAHAPDLLLDGGRVDLSETGQPTATGGCSLFSVTRADGTSVAYSATAAGKVRVAGLAANAAAPDALAVPSGVVYTTDGPRLAACVGSGAVDPDKVCWAELAAAAVATARRRADLRYTVSGCEAGLPNLLVRTVCDGRLVPHAVDLLGGEHRAHGLQLLRCLVGSSPTVWGAGKTGGDYGIAFLHGRTALDVLSVKVALADASARARRVGTAGELHAAVAGLALPRLSIDAGAVAAELAMDVALTLDLPVRTAVSGDLRSMLTLTPHTKPIVLGRAGMTANGYEMPRAYQCRHA